MNLLSSDKLSELMQEAIEIMEGWENYNDGADDSAE